MADGNGAREMGLSRRPSTLGKPFQKGHQAQAKRKRFGPRPAFVQEASRMGYLEAVPFLRKVVKGEMKRVVEVATASGKVVKITVEPSINERTRAADILAKWGGLALTAPEEQEDRDESGSEIAKIENLSDGELEQLEALLTKAGVGSMQRAAVPEQDRDYDEPAQQPVDEQTLHEAFEVSGEVVEDE